MGSMNTIQRTILFATAGLLIVMLLFPPFESKGEGRTENLGYSFILKPPRDSRRTGSMRGKRYVRRTVWMTGSVRVRMLGLQFLIVTAAGGILFFAFKTERKPSDDDVDDDVEDDDDDSP